MNNLLPNENNLSNRINNRNRKMSGISFGTEDNQTNEDSPDITFNLRNPVTKESESIVKRDAQLILNALGLNPDGSP